MRQHRSLGDLHSPYLQRVSVLSQFANEEKTGRRTTLQSVGISVQHNGVGSWC